MRREGTGSDGRATPMTAMRAQRGLASAAVRAPRMRRPMRRGWAGALLALLVPVAVLLALRSAPARADLQVLITKGVTDPIPIAVVPFRPRAASTWPRSCSRTSPAAAASG